MLGFEMRQSGWEVEPSSGTGGSRGSWLRSLLSLLLVLGLVSGCGKKVEVPDVKGKTEAQALEKLKAAGLAGEVRGQFQSDQFLPGQVLDQNPKAGDKVNEGSVVELTLVEKPSAPAKVRVPGEIIGKHVREAMRILQSKGLKGAEKERRFTGNFPDQHVIESMPVPGEELEPNATVQLIVEADSATVPDIMGKNLVDAVSALQNRGLQLGNLDQRTVTGAAVGTVIAQSPGKDKRVEKGTDVDLVLGTDKRILDIGRFKINPSEAVRFFNLPNR